MISSAGQKFLASGVNCSLVIGMAWPFKRTLSSFYWRVLTAFIFWLYEVICAKCDLGMLVAGTHFESPPNGLLAATCYTCSFCSLLFRIRYPGDLTVINGCLQIYCLVNYHNTLHGLCAGYRTMAG